MLYLLPIALLLSLPIWHHSSGEYVSGSAALYSITWLGLQYLDIVHSAVPLASHAPEDFPNFNIIVIRCPKTGSTTAGLIMEQIAHRYNIERIIPSSFLGEIGYLEASRVVAQRGKPGPYLLTNHAEYHNWMDHVLVDPFKVSVVREPLSRALSSYSFRRCMHGASDAYRPADNYMYNYIRGPRTAIADVIANYDLLMVTERFTESQAVLAKLLGIPVADTFVHPFTNAREYLPIPSAVKEEFRQRYGAGSPSNKVDHEFYESVGHTLDAHLRRLFQPQQLQADLHTLNTLMQEAKDDIEKKQRRTRFPCDWGPADFQKYRQEREQRENAQGVATVARRSMP